MARLASARRGFESAGSRALDGRGRDRRCDGSEECDTRKHDDPGDHSPDVEKPTAGGPGPIQPGPSRRTPATPRASKTLAPLPAARQPAIAMDRKKRGLLW